MKVTVSLAALEISRAALVRHKAIAQSGSALAKRLLISEGEFLTAQGANEFLTTALQHNPSAVTGREVELTLEAAKHWRAAIGIWARDALKKSEQCDLLKLATNVAAQEKAAQTLLDALNEQLGLELGSLDELVKESEPPKVTVDPGAKDPEERKQAEAADAAEEERAFRKGTMQGPHRGVGKHAPPKTAGKKTLEFTRRGGKRGR